MNWRKKQIAWLRDKAPAFAKRVAPHYELAKWKWHDGVPGEHRIAFVILRSVDGLEKDKTLRSMHTGGLSVEVDEEDGAMLRFSITEKGP